MDGDDELLDPFSGAETAAQSVLEQAGRAYGSAHYTAAHLGVNRGCRSEDPLLGEPSIIGRIIIIRIITITITITMIIIIVICRWNWVCSQQIAMLKDHQMLGRIIELES